MAWFVSNGKNKVVTQEMPVVIVKENLKKVEISGHSRMPDAAVFYEELIRKLESCFHSFKKTLILDFQLEYINTASSKWIYEMLVAVQSMADNGGIIQVNWCYEEDDEIIFEEGQVLKSCLKLDIELKEIDT